MPPDRITIDGGFMEAAQAVLRQMVAEGKTEAPLGGNFPNLVVIIGPTEKTTVMEVAIPSDLAASLGGNTVFVANK